MVNDNTEKVANFVKKVGAGKKRAPHIKDVVEHIMTEFGGSAKFAREFHREFLNCRPGSMQRARMLESTLRLMEHLSAKDAGLTDDTGLLDEADIQAAARDLMEKADAGRQQAESSTEN